MRILLEDKLLSASLKAIEIYEELVDKDMGLYLEMLAINYINMAMFYNQNFDYEKAAYYNKKSMGNKSNQYSWNDWNPRIIHKR